MRHVEHRNMERIEDPKRFNIKPTLGQLAERIPPHTRNEDDSQSSSVPSPPNNNAQSYFSSHNAKSMYPISSLCDRAFFRAGGTGSSFCNPSLSNCLGQMLTVRDFTQLIEFRHSKLSDKTILGVHDVWDTVR